MAYTSPTRREPCPVCNGAGELTPVDLNPDRPTLATILRETVVCFFCLGCKVIYVTPQPERIPA